MPYRGHFWVTHFESFDRIEDNLGHNQPSILLVVGGHHIPRGICCVCRTESFLKGFHMLLPELPLLDVREAEFPVTVRLVDVRQRCKKNLTMRVPLQ